MLKKNSELSPPIFFSGASSWHSRSPFSAITTTWVLIGLGVRRICSFTSITVATGLLFCFHSAGSLLEFNPHLRCIVLNGTLPDDGHFCELPSIDNQALEERFSQKVFRALLAEQLISQDVVGQMSPVENPELVEGGTFRLQYLCQGAH